ncbi:MAG: hypothetical protein CO108_16420 [Deltaproteobacteria bacterium CG_4_9_14_3_um_filter_63_12]|nr:MAG: hypothetical protein CO108_16420 [Deltaproteobacteria bacterium CG_4_9_14_3_um_filter_63_12]
MLCPHCRQESRTGAPFCTNCGRVNELYDDAEFEVSDRHVITQPDARHEDHPVPRLPQAAPSIAGEAPLRSGQHAPIAKGAVLFEQGHEHEIDMDFDEDAQIDLFAHRDDDVGFDDEPIDSERSEELEAILSQLQVDDLDDEEDAPRLLAGTENDEAEPEEEEEEESFSIGNLHEGGVEFAFGDDDDDSGPIPVLPNGDDETQVPTHQRRASTRTAAVLMSTFKAKFASIRASTARSVRKQRKRPVVEKQKAFLALILLMAVFGIGYAIFAGGDGSESDDSKTTAAAASETVQETTSEAPTSAEPSYELVRLTTGGNEMASSDTTPHAQAATAKAETKPTKSAKAGVKFSEQNVLLAASKNQKKHTLTRTCVLREGPASRFAQIRPLNENEALTILEESAEDWQTVEQNGLYGWTKKSDPCTGAACVVRMGPGENFRPAAKGDSMPRPTSRVVSSSRWQYVQAKDRFGWLGPACFK